MEHTKRKLKLECTLPITTMTERWNVLFISASFVFILACYWHFY